MTTAQTILAANLTKGMQIAEADGFLFDVMEVTEKTERTITVRLASDFSSMRSHWTTNGGKLQTFDNFDVLEVIPA